MIGLWQSATDCCATPTLGGGIASITTSGQRPKVRSQTSRVPQADQYVVERTRPDESGHYEQDYDTAFGAVSIVRFVSVGPIGEIARATSNVASGTDGFGCRSAAARSCDSL